MKEIWKDIGIYNGIDYSGLYQVSNLGNVRSLDRYVNNNGALVLKKGRVLTPFVAAQYKRVHLAKDSVVKNVSIHRLVAIAFVENDNPTEYTEVNHKDEDKLNNRFDNLEWCNRASNQKSYAQNHPIDVIENIKKGGFVHRVMHQCPVCKRFTYNRVCCSKGCSKLFKSKTKRPNRTELKNLIRTTTFTEIGKNYGVTDNAVRKWCKSYNLPYKTSVIKSYTEEDWELI